MLEVRLKRQLRDFELDVALEAPGEGTLALIGPTGCGKTMTLRMIAGLEEPDSGYVAAGETVFYDSAAHLSLAAHHRRVGFLFQDYALFPHMTVLGNVSYGLQARGIRGSQAREEAEQILGRLEILSLAAEHPRRLSGGQRQRVALARALATDPRLLLLDEPVSALDAQVRNHIRSELRTFIQNAGICTIIVTHDHVDALTLADHICVMHEGRVVQSGSRQELLTRPASQFVADFLGLNLFQGTATKLPDGTVEVQCAAGRFYTTEEITGPVFLTCHPYDVTISLESPSGSALNIVRGRVTSLIHLGATVRATVSNGGSIVAEVSARSAEEMKLAMGQEVYAHFKAAAARCYE